MNALFFNSSIIGIRTMHVASCIDHRRVKIACFRSIHDEVHAILKGMTVFINFSY